MNTEEICKEIFGERWNSLDDGARESALKVALWFTSDQARNGDSEDDDTSPDEVFKALDVALEEAEGTSLEEVMSERTRRWEVVTLRKMAFKIFRSLTGCPWMDMERLFGYDHSTIWYGVQTYGDLLATSATERALTTAAGRALPAMMPTAVPTDQPGSATSIAP